MLRILISAAEALGLLIVLVLALNYSVPLVIWLSFGLLLVAAFVLITGRTVPRIQSRGKSLLIGSIAGVCLMASATIYQDQRGDPPSPAYDLVAMIAQSDDLSRHTEAFRNAATALVQDRTCSEADFIENGGWVRSTSFDPRQVYFMFCGGSTVADRIYLDAETGEVFR